MTAIQIADSFDSFAIDHTPDGWPAVQQKQLTEAAAELRRLEAQLQKETAARQAAQIEAEALKERLVRADAEKCAAVLAERIAPKAPMQEPVHKLIYPGGGKALFDRLWHLTCNAVATQSGMRVRTDVLPMREMKEFLDHLCVLVDSPPLPAQEPLGDEFAKVLHDNLWELYDNSTTPAPVQEPVCRGCGIPINDIHMSTCPTKKWPMYVTPADAAQPAPVQEPEKLNPLTQLQVADVMGLRDAQPRKAVKLTELELLELWEAAPLGTLASTRLQAVQAAVWAKLGVEP